jgi:hypothetical protein
VTGMLGDLRKRVESFFRNDPAGALVLSLLTPEPPFQRGKLVSALVAASSMICVAALAGVTLVALGVLLLALFLLSIILTRVLGIEIGIPPEFRRYAY